jgi:hypothetical protein
LLGPRAPDLELSLLFDSGADRIVLQPSWEDCFENLEDTVFGGLGDKDQPGKPTTGKIRLLGQIIECDIGFTKMTERTWMQGVFGRECFKSFGFGFWEKSHELYVTVKP